MPGRPRCIARTGYRILAALLALGLALGPLATPSAFSGSPASGEASSMERAIERFVAILDRASRSPAGKVGGLILRAYTAYKAFQNAREIAAVRRTVHDMLRDIAEILERVERGETLSEEQWAEANVRLDNHAARIAGIESRLDRVEQVIPKVIRRVCPEYHALVEGKGPCVDFRTIDARSR
jgi:hypothetical protein